MGFLKNALIYLGFVEDELGEDISTYGGDPRRSVRQLEEDSGYQRQAPTYADARYDYGSQPPPPAPRPRPRETRQPADQLASVHPLAPKAMGQVHIVRPESYGDAQQIGDRMRRGLPVIVNLEDAESELARRIVAFASGLVYGLDGNLQKLSRRIYLITPGEMEVSSEDKRRLTEESGLGF